LTKQPSCPSTQTCIVLRIEFNGYTKDVYIIVVFSKKWEDISENQEIRSGSPNKVSSAPTLQFERRNHKYNELGKSLLGSLPGNIGHCTKK
jgi:hypothetical protein